MHTHTNAHTCTHRAAGTFYDAPEQPDAGQTFSTGCPQAEEVYTKKNFTPADHIYALI